MRAAFLAAVVLLTACEPAAPPPKPSPPPPVGPAAGQTAPSFSLIDSKGAPYVEAGFVGRKAQLLAIGTTACPLCQAKVADLEAVRQKRGKDIEVAAVLLSATPDAAEKYAADFKAGFRMVVDPQNLTMLLYKPGTYPHFVLIDRQGVIRYTGHELPGATLLDEASR